MLTEDTVTGTPLLPRNDAQMNIRQRIMGRRQTRGPILAKKEICYGKFYKFFFLKLEVNRWI